MQGPSSPIPNDIFFVTQGVPISAQTKESIILNIHGNRVSGELKTRALELSRYMTVEIDDPTNPAVSSIPKTFSHYSIRIVV